jgi:hypothetical protein
MEEEEEKTIKYPHFSYIFDPDGGLFKRPDGYIPPPLLDRDSGKYKFDTTNNREIPIGEDIMSELGEKKEEDPSDRDLIEFAAGANKILEGVVTESYVLGVSNGPYHSAHESFADLLETMDQIKGHVFTQPSHRDLLMMDRDLSLLASKVLRMILDICRGGDITYDPGEEGKSAEQKPV